MNSKKAKKLRRMAERFTQHAPEVAYHDTKTQRLAECTRGAYKALKSERFTRRVAI